MMSEMILPGFRKKLYFKCTDITLCTWVIFTTSQLCCNWSRTIAIGAIGASTGTFPPVLKHSQG